MTIQRDSTDYASLFVRGVPLLDLRAPVEFARGAFPNATNLPLLSDDERHQIGICYQQNGQAGAIALGHRLVSGPLREARMQAWLAWCRAHPQGAIYCFRGGLRSQLVGEWLAAAGCRMPLVHGGYKAMRRYLLQSIEPSLARLDLRLLCGRTGSGKTRVIQALEAALDLEAHAHHRGSAFGRRAGGQPTQIGFENAVAVDLLRFSAAGAGTKIVVEDEGKLIGRCYVPEPLHEQMARAPQILIEEPLESRVALTLDDYVIAPLDEYRHALEPDAAFEALAADLLAALDRIRKRLGGTRHAEVRCAMQFALERHRTTGDATHHHVWIRRLLCEYYDPMYDYLLERRAQAFDFVGTRGEVLGFLRAPPSR
jgi:tRNA 2-selenouridine synthase